MLPGFHGKYTRLKQRNCTLNSIIIGDTRIELPLLSSLAVLSQATQEYHQHTLHIPKEKALTTEPHICTSNSHPSLLILKHPGWE